LRRGYSSAEFLVGGEKSISPTEGRRKEGWRKRAGGKAPRRIGADSQIAGGTLPVINRKGGDRFTRRGKKGERSEAGKRRERKKILNNSGGRDGLHSKSRRERGCEHQVPREGNGIKEKGKKKVAGFKVLRAGKRRRSAATEGEQKEATTFVAQREKKEGKTRGSWRGKKRKKCGKKDFLLSQGLLHRSTHPTGGEGPS